MTGYAELDAAGSWRVERKYGPVWTPKAPPERLAPLPQRALALAGAVGLELG